jgi:hypothetical protein
MIAGYSNVLSHFLFFFLFGVATGAACYAYIPGIPAFI